MITGCNTNVLYRGKQFHVQTEDSGRANPHIISHVYHGGTIIASEKSSYGDRVDAEELDIKVRAKIELQHKTMLKRLTSGELDAVIDERLGGAVAAKSRRLRGLAKRLWRKAPRAVANPPAPTSGAAAEPSGSVTSGAAPIPPALPIPPNPPAPSRPVAAEPSGSVTSGDTDPSIDVERPAADTEPIFDGTSTPGFGTAPIPKSRSTR